MNLAFANPALLFGLAAVAIPVAIHLFFRRRPRPIALPTIDFVLRARKETQRRLRLKKLLLFTARTLLLGAMATAIARPRAEQRGGGPPVVTGPRATAIVLDASGSMRYRMGSGTLFDRAREDAREVLASLSEEEPITVLVCGGEPPTAEAPTFDRAAASRALDRAAPYAGHSDLTACVQAAAQALSSAPSQMGLPKRVVVATDLAASAWRLDAPPPTVEGPKGPVRPEVSVLDAARGAELPNRAIVGVEAEPDPTAGPRGFRFTATLMNYGKEPLADLPLSLQLGAGPGQKTVLRSFVELPALGSARKRLLESFPKGGPAAVEVSIPGDALPLDDTWGLVVDVPRDVRALIVDGAPSPVKYRDEAYFVESALSSAASPVRTHLVDGEALATEDLAQYDVVFLLNVRSVGGRSAALQRYVLDGGGLFVSMGDQVDPDLYARELGGVLPMTLHAEKSVGVRGEVGGGGAARFAGVDFDHPALSVFTGEAREGLLGTRFFRYLLAGPGRGGAEPSRVLAAFDDGAPALVEARRGRGRVLLFTSSMDRTWTDWPIRTSFLPALQRFAAYLSGGLTELRTAGTVLGARHSFRLAEGEKLFSLVGPDGRERPAGELDRAGLTRQGEEVSWAPPEPGLWQVKVSVLGEERLEPKLSFAVWPDPRESDTRRLDPAVLTAWLGGTGHAHVAGDARVPQSRELPLWSILLALGVLAFVAEGFLLG